MDFVPGLIEAHNQFKATLGEADKEYKTIIHLVDDAQQTGEENNVELSSNPYTNIQPDVSHSKGIISKIFFLLVGNQIQME